MKKRYFPLLVAGTIFSACGEKPADTKKDSVPVAELNASVEFKPRGDLVTAYEEVYSHTDDSHWVEVYLFTSKDSIIVTEIEKLSKESIEPPAIYCFQASREQLNVKSLVALDYDMVKEPVGMKKVSMEVKDENHMVTQWVSDPRSSAKPETILVSGIRVLTKDEEQANEIMEKLKSGF